MPCRLFSSLKLVWRGLGGGIHIAPLWLFRKGIRMKRRIPEMGPCNMQEQLRRKYIVLRGFRCPVGLEIATSVLEEPQNTGYDRLLIVS